MLCIHNTNTNPFFNAAAEEYFLKHSQEDVFMLYRNEPSVIVGKYQDIQAEVNVDFIEQHRINVVRRYSGGGAVYHDLGNLNLSFIESSTSLNFDRFTQVMIDLLAGFGLTIAYNERKALTIDGLKISGSAQGIYKNRVIYHATLLFSSDLAKLISSLDGDDSASSETKPSRLSVRSVKSPVTNLMDHITPHIDAAKFGDLVMNYFLHRSSSNTLYQLSEEDIQGIAHLKDTKYSTPEWINQALIPSNKIKTKPVFC